MRILNMYRQVSLLALFMLAVTGGGCSGQPDVIEEVTLEDYPTLQGRFVEEGVLEPLTAVDAFIGDDEFFISYEGVDGLVYAGGNWSKKIDIIAVEQNTDGTYTGPYILPLEYQQRKAWTEIPSTPILPRLLSSEQWGRFREQLFASVLPRAGKVGVVMYFDNDDYFLFYNDTDRFEARRILEKPADYSIGEGISFAEFIRRGLPQLKVFLEQEGVSERRIVFNTGDVGAYSLPFLYVDLDLPIAVFVRYAPAPKDRASADSATQMAQSLGHVAQSHLGGLIVRPISSVFRLFFVVKDVAVETLTPSWMVTLEATPIPEIRAASGMNLDHWEVQLEQILGRGPTSGVIDFLIDGEEFFTRFIDAITTARESINIRTYIFDNDDFAEKIGELLRRRADEGVEIKVLLDGLGTIIASGDNDESMPADYVPPESVRLFLEADSQIEVRQSKNPWLVSGDHVKTTIIDHEIAFTGGMNIGREYRYVWHDMMMELRGPVVDILTNEFNDAWAHAGFFGDVGYFFHKMRRNAHYAEDAGYPLQVLFTRPGNAEIFRAQKAAIRSAEKYIYIQNAYFTDDAMLYELAKARRRGVDVRVIMPLRGNHGPVNTSNILAVNAMLEHGIRVFVYPGMSHIKAAVFDGWACLGSANWDKLSFRTNKELNIATSNPEAVNELLERVFYTDFEKSVELTEPFPERWLDHLLEILADYFL